jgi:oxidase EvaA
MTVSVPGTVTAPVEFRRWFADRLAAEGSAVTTIDFADLDGWHFEPGRGDLVHDSGRFFTVGGLRVESTTGPVHRWSQPILFQPETGLLGLLLKRFDGVPHCLMQAKMEPGNHNGLQLSPTVQATRSNYTAVHGGRPVPYLEYFLGGAERTVLADVNQGELGTWFYQKRNRHMAVEVTGDVEVRDGFCWLSLAQLHELLAVDDLVNMDSRSLLACLPRRSERTADEEYHDRGELLSWLTGLRSSRDTSAVPIPLREVERWKVLPDRITHETGAFFDVRAVAVTGGQREVGGWTQPIIAPHGIGVVAFLTARLGGVPHVLTRARTEPGFLDFVELGPTVQAVPENYRHLPGDEPALLDLVLQAPPADVRFDAVLSEEGGRLYHARNRHLIVEVDPARTAAVTAPGSDGPPRFHWMAHDQLCGLLRHSHYVNVQARSLVACLRGLEEADGRPADDERGRS